MLTNLKGLRVWNENFVVTLETADVSPVVVAVPHDGMPVAGFTGAFRHRDGGIHARDKHVWPITTDAVQFGLEAGVKISAVQLLVPRKFIDGNRIAPNPDARQAAYDDPGLAPFYDTYHATIDRLLTRAIEVFGRPNVLFIDMHGFGRQPFDVISRRSPDEASHYENHYDLVLGTGNRETVTSDVDRLMAAHMRDCGYKVFLPEVQPLASCGDPFNAGHTTRRVAREHAVDAIQIEIDSGFRGEKDGEKGRDLAMNIARFLHGRYVRLRL